MIDYEKLRVLVIDDHPGMRASLRATLANFGVVKTDMAMTAYEATRRLQNLPYDVIVCDYNLGDGRDGQQFLEELRHSRLIPLSTIFLMVTAERSYERVMSACELAPDDYLIKPFSAETLRARLDKVVLKKAAFASVYNNIENGRVEEALRQCDLLVVESPLYTVDALRLKAELLIALGRVEEAQTLYEEVIAMRAVPWARMGLAKTLFMQDRFDEAERELLDLSAAAPDYLAAVDLLAEVQHSQSRTAQAQETLAQAVAASPNTLARQKAFGELAFTNGDLAAAERAFTTVVEKGQHSIFRSPDDHARLARVQVEADKFKEAGATLQQLRTHYPNDPKASFAAAVVDCLKETRQGNAEAARQMMQEALQLRAEVQGSLSETQTLDLAQACLANGADEEGRKLLTELVNNNHDNPVVLERTQRLFKDLGRDAEGERLVQGAVKNAVSLNNEAVMRAREGDLAGAVEMLVEAATRLPNNVQILLNAAQAVLTLVRQAGWDAERVALAESYIDRARKRKADHPKLPKVQALYRETAQHYGVTS